MEKGKIKRMLDKVMFVRMDGDEEVVFTVRDFIGSIVLCVLLLLVVGCAGTLEHEYGW